jgi:hypothetical protein
MNPALSQLAGITTTYKKLSSGEMIMSSEGQTYRFRMDGKESRAASGMTVTWIQIDPHTWVTVYKNPGMQTTDTTTLSPNGQTLTVVTKGVKPNGETFQETSTSQRMSGGPGLEGQWKTTQVKTVAQVWDIQPNGADGLIVKMVDFNAVCALKFDGKNYPVNGPTVPRHYTLSVKKTGLRSLEMTERMNTKVVYVDSFGVSADGKQLTTEGAAPGSSEKTKVVYEKQ